MNEVILIIGHPHMDAERIGRFIEASAKACGMEAAFIVPVDAIGNDTPSYPDRHVSGEAFDAAVRDSGGYMVLDEWAKLEAKQRLNAHLVSTQTGIMGEYGFPFPIDCQSSGFYDSGSYRGRGKSRMAAAIAELDTAAGRHKAHQAELNKLRGANRNGFKR